MTLGFFSAKEGILSAFAVGFPACAMGSYSQLRSVASSMGIRDSLNHLWAFTRNMVYELDLPSDYRGINLRDSELTGPAQVREFHLDLYAREILLHAGPSRLASRTLGTLEGVAAMHNALLRYSDTRSSKRSEIYLTLHRLSQQQMPYFDRADWAYLGRHWLLFKQDAMSALFERVLGLSSMEYVRFAAGMFTIYLFSSECEPTKDLAPLLIPSEILESLVRRMSASATEIRRRMTALQRHDSTWQFTFNELIATPLIQLPQSSQGRLICPRPPLLLKRMLAGVFYDLLSSDADGYSKAVGDGVDQAVGKLIENVLGTPARKPIRYGPPRRRKDGVDWIIEDQSGYLFIECKASRIPRDARSAATSDHLREGMRSLANAVAQNTINTDEAMRGVTGWLPDGRPAYSLVVTLEDWTVFSPAASTELRSLTEAKLLSRSVDPNLLAIYPSTITSLFELPDLLHAIRQDGIDATLKRKTSKEFEQYLVSAFLRETGKQSSTARDLFNKLGTDLFLEIMASMDPVRAETLKAEIGQMEPVEENSTTRSGASS